MRILVVNGDSAVLESIVLMLESEDFKVYADDGDDAEDLGKLYEHDAIVLGDRLDVLQAWRAAKVKTPVIVTSTSRDTESVVRALGLGADDYMIQPFHRDELIARINAVVRRSRGHAQSIVSAGGVTLNLDTRTIDVHGAPLHLTGKEYGLLECLFLRKGMVQSKDQILTALYGGMDEPDIKIIDVFVCKLRHKIAAAGAADVIETVWGRGYLVRDRTESPSLAPEIRDLAGMTDGANFHGQHTAGQVIRSNRGAE